MLIPSKSIALCCIAVGWVIFSKTKDLLPIDIEIVILTIVAKSSNKVWKLWTGKLSEVRFLFALFLAFSLFLAGDTTDSFLAAAASQSS